MGQLKMEEKPFRYSQLHQFILYHIYIFKILNHNLNHHPEKKEKREIKLESKKILNILLLLLLFEKLIKGIRKGFLPL